jgi:hypothetical protein
MGSYETQNVNFLKISLPGLVHSGGGGEVLAVNNFGEGFAGILILFGDWSCSRVAHRGISVDKLCISNATQFQKS